MNTDKTAVDYNNLDLSDINPLTDIATRRETIRSKAKRIQRHLTHKQTKAQRNQSMEATDAATSLMEISKKTTIKADA
jgi:hypothetical protein